MRTKQEIEHDLAMMAVEGEKAIREAFTSNDLMEMAKLRKTRDFRAFWEAQAMNYEAHAESARVAVREVDLVAEYRACLAAEKDDAK